MMEQYQAAKEKNQDALLFFRLGDFFEMFADDAVTASKELGLTLTHRQNYPMCGVPAHAVENYLQKLVQKGYRVAVVDQVGDPKGKGLTERELTKIVTPGTILTDDTLTNANNNFLILILENREEIALAGADVSTGEIFYCLYEGTAREQNLFDELYRLTPHEILIADELTFEKNLKNFVEIKLENCLFTKIEIDDGTNLLAEHFPEKDFPASDTASQAVENLLAYIHKTIRTNLNHISKLTRLDLSSHLILDANTLKNLEVVRNLRDGSKKNTLFSVLDLTKTPLGTRLLKKRLESPLTDPAAIIRRFDSVEELLQNFSTRKNLRELLKEIHDIERLMTKIEIGSANARDLTALKISLRILPKISAVLKNISSDILLACRDGLKNFSAEVDLIDRAISEDAPLTIRDGGIINRGFNDDLDEYRKISQDSRTFLQEFEENEKIRTGIKGLKVGYNKVFGYYIEVRHSGADKIPENYIRKQTLTQAERYITQELKDFETKILGAHEKIVTLEYNIFCQIRDEIKKKLSDIQDSAKRIAVLDVTAALAEVAEQNNYVRPDLNLDGKILISDGRHALVEKILSKNIFVPNDTNLNPNNCSIMVITGPNMAGKSTYMRQVALITLMAQAGSFVPAKSANISPVDRIFTRIGAGDDLVSGQSTFMVEMNEVAQILKFATKKSLIILDEVGRGTSTFDGMSIARSVIEYIDKKIRAKTLFATHYHELTDLAEKSERIENFSVAVKERGNEVIFLRRIKTGGADKSYGIQVAKLAGLPKAVMKRAEEILFDMEKNQPEKNFPVQKNSPPTQNLFISGTIEELINLDVTTLTPIEAMNKLFELQKKVREESGHYSDFGK
ncbi:MAG: DNA mismatch repair protein MutS [Selenomonadaceae bacterium]|nr:DNA mismatch repair protein MutS [Selenomonadaceae bacterium]